MSAVATATRFDIVSPLEGVPASAWRLFVKALTVQPAGKVALGGGLGMYNIRPRRIVEIGRATSFRRIGGRQVCTFVAPWTEQRFLADPAAQYAVLVKSMRLYYDALRDGSIKKPRGASMSGVLAVLHAGGMGALDEWPNLSFKETKALYEATKGIF